MRSLGLSRIFTMNFCDIAFLDMQHMEDTGYDFSSSLSIVVNIVSQQERLQNRFHEWLQAQKTSRYRSVRPRSVPCVLAISEPTR